MRGRHRRGKERDIRLPDDGGEDFSEFLARLPGAFAFVGAAPVSNSPGLRRMHHAPDFDFDERALPVAARLLAAYARSVLAGE